MNGKKSQRTAIEPTRSENYPEWYQSLLKAADLAEHAPVRGCMVIKPWGYSLWENIRALLDKRLKETGHQNAYFPLFIPLSFMEREAQHVEGFAKECAVVTHHRLEKDSKGKLAPAGELEEPLIVRPTSEMLIGDSFAKWIHSYRDLPLLINQWANVVRWEMRTRMFLRTAEFLWQEGHTAHATKQEALDETMRMIELYSNFCREVLAMPVLVGEKTEQERFPGAVSTYTIEGMMQDGKALQMGTSHFLGQNFAKSCEILFNSKEGRREYVWTTSWGVTTRLIGGLIMTHGDDDGLIVPPRIAEIQLVLLPIIHKEEHREKILAFCEEIAIRLRKVEYCQEPLRVSIDSRDLRAGEKSWSWIKKGVPLRLEIGMREIESDQLALLRRDRGHKEKIELAKEDLVEKLPLLLAEIQSGLFHRALTFRKEHTHRFETLAAMEQFFSSDQPGFALCHWNRDPAFETRMKEKYNATIRCIPLESKYQEKGSCIFSGEPSSSLVVFAKAY